MQKSHENINTILIGNPNLKNVHTKISYLYKEKAFTKGNKALLLTMHVSKSSKRSISDSSSIVGTERLVGLSSTVSISIDS